MYAIPPSLRDGLALVTGVSCPDCGGVLQVRTEGHGSMLIFECRIGHTYDVAEVLEAKEERLEEHLWAADTILEELVELLRDLAEHAAHHDEPAAVVQAFRRRAARAKANAASLRAVIAETRPVDLAPADPGRRSGGRDHPEGSEPGGGAGGQ